MSIAYPLCTLITPGAPQHHVHCRPYRTCCKPVLRIILWHLMFSTAIGSVMWENFFFCCRDVAGERCRGAEEQCAGKFRGNQSAAEFPPCGRCSSSSLVKARFCMHAERRHTMLNQLHTSPRGKEKMPRERCVGFFMR